MTREEAKRIVKGITDKIECNTADIDDWAEFWGFTREEYEEFLDTAIKALEQEPVLDKIRAEIAECGSIRVTFAITDETKTDKGIEKLARDILARAKEQVLDIIDKHKAESEDEKMKMIREVEE